MPETATPPPAEISVSDPSRLDAILNELSPMPVDDGASAVGSASDAAAAVKDKEPPAAKETTVVPPSKEAAPPAVTDDGFTPPPSILEKKDESGAAAAAGEEDPYGTMPEEPPTGIKSEKNKAEYKKWRDSHEKLKLDLQTALKQVNSRPEVDPEKYAGLEAQLADAIKRNEELNSIVERRWAEELPYVKKTFDAPREVAIKDAEKALTLAKIDPATVKSILSLPEMDRVEALDEIYGRVDSEYVKKKLGAAFDRIESIDAQKAAFLQDREGNTKVVTEAEAAEQSRRFAEQEKNLNATVDATIEHFAEKLGFEFLRKSSEPGYEKWNERVDRDRELIRELTMKNQNPQRFIAAITAGVTAPHYRVAWQNAMTKLAAKDAEIARLKGAIPSLDGKTVRTPVEMAQSNGMDPDMIAAGVTPEDDLPTVARKLGNWLQQKQ